MKASEKTLIEHGAVSEEAVEEMVEGLLCISGADVGLAVSGIAGPGGATDSKPIGMVCAALKINDELIKETWMLGHLERKIVIERAINKSLEFIANNLEL